MMYGSRPNPTPAGPGSLAQVDANDAFDMAIQFEQRDDLPAAEEAYRAADQLGHAAAAVSLGVLLEERDDLDGAEQAFRRADERGDANGRVPPGVAAAGGRRPARRRGGLPARRAARASGRAREPADDAGRPRQRRRPVQRRGAAAGRPERRRARDGGATARAGAGDRAGAGGRCPSPSAAPAARAGGAGARGLDEPSPSPSPSSRRLELRAGGHRAGARASRAGAPGGGARGGARAGARDGSADLRRGRGAAHDVAGGVPARRPRTSRPSPASIATKPTPWPPPSPRRRHRSQGSPPPRWLPWQPAPPAGRRTDPKRTAAGTPEAQRPARSARPSARRASARKGGLVVRMLAIAIPVAAFAAAFILGAGSRPHDPAPAHLATALRSARQRDRGLDGHRARAGQARRRAPPGQEDQGQARAQGRDGHAQHRHVGAVEQHAAGLASARRPHALDGDHHPGSGGSSVTTNGTRHHQRQRLSAPAGSADGVPELAQLGVRRVQARAR